MASTGAIICSSTPKALYLGVVGPQQQRQLSEALRAESQLTLNV